MDLGTATTLETQLRSMMDSVDELNQESIKFNKHQNLMLKQFQEKTRFIQKRQLENQARIARGEEPLPEEDMSKLFKNVAAPSRLNPLILSGTISFTADEVRFLALADISSKYLYRRHNPTTLQKNLHLNQKGVMNQLLASI